eukprot:TRINITY_DN3434_c0_g1_i2.p1 TRINITY_DN3434_c0_g1~~TRINITY_DN3434_c0_g1_i2.p1  ORF type:complete len:481 (-),score=101.88 TRINITY_DN3434_c0_g1_i2:78-1520(-)
MSSRSLLRAAVAFLCVGLSTQVPGWRATYNTGLGKTSPSFSLARYEDVFNVPCTMTSYGAHYGSCDSGGNGAFYGCRQCDPQEECRGPSSTLQYTIGHGIGVNMLCSATPFIPGTTATSGLIIAQYIGSGCAKANLQGASFAHSDVCSYYGLNGERKSSCSVAGNTIKTSYVETPCEGGTRSDGPTYVKGCVNNADGTSTLTMCDTTAQITATTGITFDSGTQKPPVAPPASSCVAITQTQTNSYMSAGKQFTQFTVRLTNNRATSASVVVKMTGTIEQIWNMVSVDNTGKYALPSYASSIASGSFFEFGYIIQASSQSTITLVQPDCSSTPSSASSSTTGTPATATGTGTGTGTGSTTGTCTGGECTPAVTSSTTAQSSTVCHISTTTVRDNGWTDAEGVHTQFTVTLTNTGSTSMSSLIITADASKYKISNVWNFEKVSSGFAAPAYALPLAAGASASFGYILKGTEAASFTIVASHC